MCRVCMHNIMRYLCKIEFLQAKARITIRSLWDTQGQKKSGQKTQLLAYIYIIVMLLCNEYGLSILYKILKKSI